MEETQDAASSNTVTTTIAATPGMMRLGGVRRSRRSRILLSAVALLALVVIAGVAWFQPYKLWINDTVNEPDPAAGAVVIAQGTFLSHEHATSGKVRLLRLSDDTLILRLDQLDTSNGPVLKVWLSDGVVRAGKDGWYVFGEGRHVDLGRLKGNKGSQSYMVPPGVDLTGISSVTIWCDRFHVSFGAATLAAAS
jgi:Electron transfer DM13